MFLRRAFYAEPGEYDSHDPPASDTELQSLRRESYHRERGRIRLFGMTGSVEALSWIRDVPDTFIEIHVQWTSFVSNSIVSICIHETTWNVAAETNSIVK
jgi:hypothetical protein